MCALMLAYSIVMVVVHSSPGILAFGIIYIVLSLAGGAFVWVLFFFHLNLVAKNITTNEYCKDTWEGIKGNPFSKTTCSKNMVKIFFGRNAKSNVDPNKIIAERKPKVVSQGSSPAKPTNSHSSNQSVQENSSSSSK